MIDGSSSRLHEVAFCAEVKSWADALFSQHPEWPFASLHIEQYGTDSNKRQDLRILGRAGSSPLLCGEVKMPGTVEGRSPYDADLMQDACQKADNIRSQYFFTWNVNTFVLFDRSRWDVQMVERRVKEWRLGLGLTESGQCLRPDVQERIREEFLPAFFSEFAEIVTGRKPDWAMPPDAVFISSLESHLDWPVAGTRDWLLEQSGKDHAFRARLSRWLTEDLQWSFNPDDPQNWFNTLDRASRTLCYVFSNRAIFYNAIRAKYADLPILRMPPESHAPERKAEYFRQRFQDAVNATGDYEPVFFPTRLDDWIGGLVFAAPQACQGWKGMLAGVDMYNFREIPRDIVGHIFQKLISTDERQKYGQYFTHEDIVDVINAFCIRRAGDTVLDPACGSGSFLVRAYHRKAWLSEQASSGRRHVDAHKAHQELLQEIFGCDIALFPAHLATLNLAARRIEDEENYPLIRRGNFFEAAADLKQFCAVPIRRTESGGKQNWPVALPALDAVVGNPPYVRQEAIPRQGALRKGKAESEASFESRRAQTKEYIKAMAEAAWPGLQLSGRSDLHCYFWPVAAKLLKEGGYFGFLTSSSWLDVEYGFPLQGWILRNFRLIAIIESVDEPWFEDARVKTCATILQRCADEKARNDNVVRFVRLQKPLAEILGIGDDGDETERQRASQKLRKLIEGAREPCEDAMLRIIPIRQRDLWREGVEAGRILTGGRPAQAEEEAQAVSGAGEYVAGKWGRFVRAPDIYFRIMRDYGRRFVRLGEIAEIRFGIKSGCDAFFMPRDVTKRIMDEVKQGLPWNDVPLRSPCKFKEVESGKVRIVKAGDGTLHPIEAEFLRPEVHSLMEVDRPVIRARDVNRVVLWVNQRLYDLAGTHVATYIRWGAKQTFESKKSKSVPVPKRSSCASRARWYDLTSDTAGAVFWPMSQQYRHIVPANPEHLPCNHNLFYLAPAPHLTRTAANILPAVLNSTLLALFKTFYGR